MVKYKELIENFRSQKDLVIRCIEKNGVSSASMLAATSGVPIIAIWAFIGEEFEEHREQAEKNIETYIKFYGYRR